MATLSFDFMRAVLRESNAPPHAQHVLWALLSFASFHDEGCACADGQRACAHMGSDLKCWPSLATLALLTNLTRLSVWRNIALLEKFDLVRRERRRTASGGGRLTTVYHIASKAALRTRRQRRAEQRRREGVFTDEHR